MPKILELQDLRQHAVQMKNLGAKLVMTDIMNKKNQELMVTNS